jgi:hypothetical protein
MRLMCYPTQPNPPRLVPAQAERAWMDDFPQRHAYRCLPMTVANTHGWDLLCPASFVVRWNGGPLAEDVTFHPDGEFPYLEHFAASHFTHGIITFQTGYLFRTEPGWNMMATGPYNHPKDGIAPLTGVIETDWLPYTFTMNWQLTRAGEVRFEKDEPFCLVYPVPKNVLEEVVPEIHAIESDADLEAEYRAWRGKREEFMARFRARDAETLEQGWQRYYFKGEYAHETAKPVRDHRNKVRLAAPIDLRGPTT